MSTTRAIFMAKINPGGEFLLILEIRSPNSVEVRAGVPGVSPLVAKTLNRHKNQTNTFLNKCSFLFVACNTFRTHFKIERLCI